MTKHILPSRVDTVAQTLASIMTAQNIQAKLFYVSYEKQEIVKVKDVKAAQGATGIAQ